MTKEIRLEAILIRFDEDGNVKGAAAYDYEQDRDGDTVTPIREMPARPIAPADVQGILTSADLDLVSKNTSLQANLDLVSEQMLAEMSGRTADGDFHRARIADKDNEIAALAADHAATVAEKDGAIAQLNEQLETFTAPVRQRQIAELEARLAALRAADPAPAAARAVKAKKAKP